MSYSDDLIVWLMNEIPHMLSKTKMLKCSFKYFSTNCAAMYAAEKMLPLLPNKAISKHVWVELIHFQILYGHELITFSCLSHFIFNYLSASLAVMVHSLVQIRFICLNWWQFSKKILHTQKKILDLGWIQETVPDKLSIGSFLGKPCLNKNPQPCCTVS